MIDHLVGIRKILINILTVDSDSTGPITYFIDFCNHLSRAFVQDKHSLTNRKFKNPTSASERAHRSITH